MKLDEFVSMSVGSLRRTKLRTFLTTSGVVIGIGALVSMVSFGAGMQKNVSDAMQKMEVFTSMEVMPAKLGAPDDEFSERDSTATMKVLNDSTIKWISSLPGVKIVYPEINVPARVRYGGNVSSTTIRAVPMAMAQFAPYKKMEWGRFFGSDTAAEIVMSSRFLKRLKIAAPDSVIGKDFEIITAKMDFSRLSNVFDLMGMGRSSEAPFAEEVTKMRLAGVWENPEFSSTRTSSVVMPLGTSRTIHHLDFTSIWDVLKNFTPSAGYPMVCVRLSHMKYLEQVQDQIELHGFRVWTIANQLAEMRRGFLIFDAVLGAVGTIALFVASLGIINTMVMSVLERYREIGIMKAIGATDWDIKYLFFFEASAIGVMGGCLGIGLGWLVTRVANVVANYYIINQGGPKVNLFFIPWWLIAGGIAFAVIVSLVAGLYPAARAARVDPVKALRHE